MEDTRGPPREVSQERDLYGRSVRTGHDLSPPEKPVSEIRLLPVPLETLDSGRVSRRPSSNGFNTRQRAGVSPAVEQWFYSARLRTGDSSAAERNPGRTVLYGYSGVPEAVDGSQLGQKTKEHITVVTRTTRKML